MRPAKLKQHLHNIHPQSKDKAKPILNDKQSFEENEAGCFRRIFTGERKIVKALYVIAKQKKPHIIRETLIKPRVLKMADIMLEKDAERKLASILLSIAQFKKESKIFLITSNARS